MRPHHPDPILSLPLGIGAPPNMVLCVHESSLQTAPQSVQPVLQGSRLFSTDTRKHTGKQTDTQTNKQTDHATSVAELSKMQRPTKHIIGHIGGRLLRVK